MRRLRCRARYCAWDIRQFQRMHNGKPTSGCCKRITFSATRPRSPPLECFTGGPRLRLLLQQHDRQSAFVTAASAMGMTCQHATLAAAAAAARSLLAAPATAYMRQSCASMDTTALSACSSARAPAAKFSSICPPLGNVCAKSTCRDCRAEHWPLPGHQQRVLICRSSCAR